MAYEIADNTGSIFANDRKEAESHPDGKGSAKIAGVEYWVNSWNNVTKDGKQYRKMTFQVKEPKADQGPAPVATKAVEMDDEIPF